MKTPINNGIAQSDLDMAGFDLLNFAGGGGGLPAGGTTGQLLQKQSSTDGDADWATVSGGAVPTQHIFYPEDYGAVGDGTTDDTTALQACVTAAVAVGGTVKLSPVTYKITSALNITGSVTIEGSGMLPQNGTSVVAGNASMNMPYVSPYLKGSVILQAGAGQNGISIGVSGLGVNLRHFGVRFADAIKFTNTGHGIFSEGATVTGGKDSGIMSSMWENLGVYGHDGNHYAYHFTNPICSTFNHITGWGGGGIRVQSNNTWSYYGNSVFEHTYFCTCVAGTAHGFHVNMLVGNDIYFLTFIRPQVNVQDAGVATPPTSAQNTFKADANSSGALYINLFAPDFETNVGSMTSGVYGVATINVTPGNVDSNPFHWGELGGDQKINGNLTANAVYIGTDLRLVPISGGGKLQARNTSTLLWADVDQWTNP